MSSASCPPARRLFAKEQQPCLSIPGPFSSVPAFGPSAALYPSLSNRAVPGDQQPSACGHQMSGLRTRAVEAVFRGLLVCLIHQFTFEAQMPCPSTPAQSSSAVAFGPSAYPDLLIALYHSERHRAVVKAQQPCPCVLGQCPFAPSSG